MMARFCNRCRMKPNPIGELVSLYKKIRNYWSQVSIS